MRRFILLSGLLVLAIGGLYAQEHSLSDTILLDEVNTYATVKKYQAGAKLESISNEQLQLSSGGGLDQLLMRFTPIYVKSNAGGLSTIRLRGTAPDHTSVNFGGLNVNSLTLGHSNMSSVPSYLFDGLDLQYGSSSAVNGSGSIGGAIYLGLKSNWTDGMKVQSTITQGSFGEQLYGAKVFVGNGRWESVTRLFYYKKKNDFPFDNPYTGDVENREPVADRQNGASIENKGLVQELNYRFNSREFIKSAVWLEHDWHEIQPNMPSNLHYKTTEQLDNKHVRFWSQYENNKQSLNYRLGVGYVHDMQVYDSIDVQRIGTDRLVSELEVKQDINSNLGYKAGLKYKYMVPDVYAYSDEVVDNEQHLDAYVSAFATFWHRLKLTLNLRQSFVTDFDAPFTPSLGAEYRLFTNDLSVLKLTSTLARSYRVPTFNDRYWGTQGNPNLKAEDGMNYELGLNYIYCRDDFQSDLKLNAFYMDVKNWIEWRNFGVWQAQNLMEVVSKGFEFQSNTDWQLGDNHLNFRLNYNFNPVEAVENVSESGVTHRQLIYVPKHMGNVFLSLKRKAWLVYADGAYTGMRYSDEFGREMDPYFLTNCGVSRQLKLGKQGFNLSFSVDNLLDVDYQNERYYAMPGRSFRLSLSTNLNII
ncbi:TonB-dependent receptor plug domain-containing protein [Sunxiuqinia rutila]|uniref:TonB-dependent receptor plug domain-containing protein n=1 Tax=Sunxiuqinia rutila TaxID=1397841 RepID=UPI003D35ECDE